MLVFSTLSRRDGDGRFLQSVREAASRRGDVCRLVASPRNGLVRKGFLRYGFDAEDFVPMPFDLRIAGYPRTAFSSDPPLAPDRIAFWTERARPARAFRHLSAQTLAGRIERWAYACNHVLARFPGEPAMLCNPCSVHTGIVRELPAFGDRPVLAFERGLIAGTFMVERDGVNACSPACGRSLREVLDEAGIDFATARARGAATICELAGKNGARRAHDHASRLPDKGGRPGVLVLGIDDTTTGVFPLSRDNRSSPVPGFGTSANVARHAALGDTASVVFKPHPSASHLVEGGTPPVFNGSPADAIAWADVVVGCGSSLDIHALASGKPLVLAGRSIVAGKGVAREAGGPGDLGGAIRAAVTGPALSRDELEAFFGWLRSGFLFTLDDRLPDRLANAFPGFFVQQDPSTVHRTFRGRLPMRAMAARMWVESLYRDLGFPKRAKNSR